MNRNIKIDVTTKFPFGIARGSITLSCTALPHSTTQVSFGGETFLSHLDGGSWIWDNSGSNKVHGSVADSLARLKRAAEKPYNNHSWYADNLF